MAPQIGPEVGPATTFGAWARGEATPLPGGQSVAPRPTVAPRRGLYATRVKHQWRAYLAVGGAGLGLGVVLVLLRGRPSVESDAGIFLSVAGRLLAGDHLYRDVFDNKDPLFFYTFAAALAGDWRLPFLLDALWLALGGAGIAALLRALGSSRLVAAIGLVAYPLLLTGAYYYAGYSMLPALGLAPLVSWLWARRRFVTSGALLGIATLYKASLLLVVASGPLALLAVALPEGRRQGAGRAAGGLAAVLAVAAALLAGRGELGAYRRVLVDNVFYSSDVLRATGRPQGLYGHLWSLAGVTDNSLAIAVVFAAGAAVAAAGLRRGRRGEGGAPPAALRALSGLLLATGSATAATLAATAVWDHHAQMLAFPGVVLVALLATAAERLQPLPLRLAAMLAAVALPVWALGGLSSAPGLAIGESWGSEGRSRAAIALEEARAALLPDVPRVTYAVLGTNNEQAHAAFLHGDWRLACPRFHQYPFSRHLDEVLACIRRRRPKLILVSYPFARRRDARTSWDVFVDGAARLLATSYRPVAGSEGIGVWALPRLLSATRSSTRSAG